VGGIVEGEEEREGEKVNLENGREVK
jgi:hypothetical protein